jgi:hypothetical protein
MTINGKTITAKEFGYDGCHKIYLINTENDKKELYEAGYTDADFFPIDELKDKFEDSCSLKFIENADLKGGHIVNQFEEAIFEA